MPDLSFALKFLDEVAGEMVFTSEVGITSSGLNLGVEGEIAKKKGEEGS